MEAAWDNINHDRLLVLDVRQGRLSKYHMERDHRPSEGEVHRIAQGMPLLLDLPPDQLRRILVNSSVRTIAAGTTLFCEDDQPEYLYALISGIVDLSRRMRRRSCGVMMLSPGDIFMPAAALFSEPYLVSATSLTSVRVLQLDLAAVRGEATQSAELAMRLGRVMGGQWRMAVRHILDLKCRSAPKRLAALLLRIVDECPFSEGSILPIPKRDLARRVGMTPETLSRTLQTIARKGLHLRGNRIIVRDRAMINAYCGPDPYSKSADPTLLVHAL